MKLFVALLVVGLANFANAAVLGSPEVLCNSTTKTVYVRQSAPKITPIFQSARVKLLLNGLTYGPAEIKFGDSFKAVVEASIATDMRLAMKIKSNDANSQILAQAESFHRDNEIGVFQGSLTVLSNEIASLADQKNISFDAASESEELTPGEHFVAASILCF